MKGVSIGNAERVQHWICGSHAAKFRSVFMMNSTQPPRLSDVVHSIATWGCVRNLRGRERIRSRLEKGALL